MNDAQLPTEITPGDRRLTAAEFQGLAEVPPEIEWFANITNLGTRRIYKIAIRDFMRFIGIARPAEFRIVTRAHVIAWRDDLEQRGLDGATRRNRLAALSSLFEYLCEKNAVGQNPVKGVKRPKAQSGEGTTPTIGDHQARQLLAAPAKETVKAKRDRAILSTLLYHALRREELCKLKVSDFRHARRGVPHLKVDGKGEKTRFLPLHPGTNAVIHDYLEAAGHGEDDNGALFRPIKNNRGKTLEHALTPDAVYKLVKAYSVEAGVRDRRPCPACDGRHQCARPPGRHRQGPGVARARQHLHHPHLRSPQDAPGGQPDFQGELLIGQMRTKPITAGATM
jgi:integrase/recombinase XerD